MKSISESTQTVPRHSNDVRLFDAGAELNEAYFEALKHIYNRLDMEGMDPAKASTFRRDINAYQRFLAELGNPHLATPTIHVTGTRGKGSSVACLESILFQAGYKIGATVSPHLVEVRERIRINGLDLDRDLFSHYYNEILPVVDNRVNGNTFRTVFELLTALAFWTFKREQVDVALVEVGMGGKLDATIVVNPELAIITRVGLDHTHVLGNTTGEIAEDKAHIIKEGVPVIVGPQPDDAQQAIDTRVREMDSTAWMLGREAKYDIVDSGKDGSVFNLDTPFKSYRNLKTPMLGRHQVENTAIAVMAADKLTADSKFKISEENVRAGLENVRWQGRGEIIRKDPTVILDGAHTPQGGKVLNEMLHDCWPDKELVFLLGFNKDKDYKSFLDCFDRVPGRTYITAVDSIRALSTDELQTETMNRGWQSEIINLEYAYKNVCDNLGKNEILVVTGSFYIVGAIRRQFLQTI